MRKILILLSFIAIFLFACSNKEEASQPAEDTTAIDKSETESTQIHEGVHLELINVGESARPIFEKYFHHVEKAHEDMIYRRTERTQEIFRQDRPDLTNAKLTYDAEANHILYTFYYTPNANDLLFQPGAPMIVVNLGSYLYIQNMIRDYFLTVKNELQGEGIYIGNNPTVAYLFDAPGNAYIHIKLVGHEAIVTVKKEDDPQEYTIPASFASGTVTLAVKNPLNTVQGENSSEARLIEFFGVSYEEFVQAVNNAQVVEDKVPEEIETPLDEAENLDATTALVYTDEDYGVTVHLPETWKGRYAVSEDDWFSDSLKTIDFTFIDEGNVISNIFSLIFFEMTEAEFQQYYGEDGGFLHFIAEIDGVSLAYNIPGEPPLELLEDPAKQPLLEELSRMINEDVSEIASKIEY